ncbi:hypothetical protein [Streptomyces xinghaiensis]|uniref:hypothetical protein n=1 Tax=Streptomyces xinghaiensis TaxID=1038928 RepID=UPI003B513E32
MDARSPSRGQIAGWTPSVRQRGVKWRGPCGGVPNRTAVLLTVFRKTRLREDAEVGRAKLAQKVCEAEHGPAHGEFVRVIEKGEVEQ